MSAEHQPKRFPDRGDRDRNQPSSTFTREEAFASVPSLGDEGDSKRIIREAKEERAERTFRELAEVTPETEP